LRVSIQDDAAGEAHKGKNSILEQLSDSFCIYGFFAWKEDDTLGATMISDGKDGVISL
jgi:hypothetical protein